MGALGILGLDDTSLNPNAQCYSCVNELSDVAAAADTGQVPSCASLCLPLWADGQATYSASGTISQAQVSAISSSFIKALNSTAFSTEAGLLRRSSNLCVDPNRLAALSGLVKLGRTVSPLKVFLGLHVAMKALGILLPGNFAMMFGSMKGCQVAKTIVPYSRMPGIIAISAIVLSLPHLVTLLVLIKCALGSQWLAGCFSFFIMANFVWLPLDKMSRNVSGFFCCAKRLAKRIDSALTGRFSDGLLAPMSHDDVAKMLGYRGYFQMAMYVGMLVCIILWLWTAASELGNLYKIGLIEIDFASVENQLKSKELWKFLASSGFKAFCNFYGLTRISAIAFTDAVLYSILEVDEADQDPKDTEFRAKHGEHEKLLFEELHTSLDPLTRKDHVRRVMEIEVEPGKISNDTE